MRRQCNQRLRCLLRNGDTRDERRMKMMGFPVACILFVLAGVGVAMKLSASRVMTALGNTVCASALAIYLVGVAFNMAPVGHLADIALGLCTVGICVLDLASATFSNPFRSWIFVILVLDSTIIFKREHIQVFILGFFMVYAATEHLESIYQYGLYDMGYWRTGVEVNFCNCASPPCSMPESESLFNYCCVCAVLLVDFYFTRGFSKAVQVQLRRVKSSVDVAADIAGALARYDVDEAEKAIEGGEHIPKELADSFQQLLCNLRSYRAYLPHSCLVSQDGEVEDAESNEAESARLGSIESFISVLQSCSSESRPRSPPQSPRASSHVGGITTSMLKAPPRRARVSLAVGNMIGYLSGELSGESNARWIAEDVEQWCSLVVGVRGVVDLIGGDRRYASFNARQSCDGHASAAVEVLSSRGDGEWSGCVVSGQAVCGDFGSISVLRFMVLGAVSSSLHPFERIAAQWRIEVLADFEAYSAACYNWEGRLLGAVFMAKRGAKPLRVYSMTSKRAGAKKGGPEEWMYELAAMPEQEHAEDNKATEALIRNRLDTLNEVIAVEEPIADGVVWNVKEVGLCPR
eukprot:Hpha_TRINITY_DN16300_c4_g2::TRINITY_DN16300_c4_g2_i1::g.60562::m.60562